MQSPNSEIWWALAVGSIVLLSVAVAVVIGLIMAQRRSLALQQQQKDELAERDRHYRTIVEDSLGGFAPGDAPVGSGSTLPLLPTETTRKLTAVMFTDIKGFSRKMSENEIKAFDLLTQHDALIRLLAAHYGGRIIKSIGDSFMIDFSSAVNAVRCSMEVQKRFHAYNQGRSDFEKIEIRIGIHLGDVIIRGGDIIGDGVNIAARVESITEPNRICISGDVYNQVRNKLALSTFRIGKMHLKNIPEPIDVHELLMEEIPDMATPSRSATLHASTGSFEVDASHERDERREAELVEQIKQRADKLPLSDQQRRRLVDEIFAQRENPLPHDLRPDKGERHL